MSDLLELILSTLLVLSALFSIVFAIAVHMFSEKSKLNDIEKNTWYYWNKEILLRSAVMGKGQTLWVLSRLHKYSAIYIIIYVAISLFASVLRSF